MDGSDEPYGTRMVQELVGKAAENEFRPGPYTLSLSGGTLPDGAPINWWQCGGSITGGYSRNAMVEACVSAYAQTCAMLPGDHWLTTGDGGRKRVETSALSRILRDPNGYQTMSDFLLNGVRALYLEGNCYALALRNSRFEVDELHLMNPNQCQAYVAPTGDIFYSLGGNEIVARRLFEMGMGGLPLVPARDVLHIKLQTPNHPLRGVSPLVSVALDIAAGDAMLAQQITFYLNQARPSFVLATDLKLEKAQVQELSDRWDEKSRGLNSGKTPILTAGIKPIPLQVSGRDAQLADIMKLNEQHIALAFRVPLALLGIGGTAFGSTESLMQFWLASGLQFCLNHIETAFDKLFGLDGEPWEYTEFDTAALLRSAQKDRIDTLVRGVQGGVYSPNEARAEVELPAVKFGDEPRVQQQVVPLSAAEAIPAAPAAPAAPPAAPPQKGLSYDARQRVAGQILDRSRRFDRQQRLAV